MGLHSGLHVFTRLCQHGSSCCCVNAISTQWKGWQSVQKWQHPLSFNAKLKQQGALTAVCNLEPVRLLG